MHIVEVVVWGSEVAGLVVQHDTHVLGPGGADAGAGDSTICSRIIGGVSYRR